jgi:hypothetical protein
MGLPSSPHRYARLVVGTGRSASRWAPVGPPRGAVDLHQIRNILDRRESPELHPEADEWDVVVPVVLVVPDRFESTARQSSEHGKQAPQNRSRG